MSAFEKYNQKEKMKINNDSLTCLKQPKKQKLFQENHYQVFNVFTNETGGYIFKNPFQGIHRCLIAIQNPSHLFYHAYIFKCFCTSYGSQVIRPLFIGDLQQSLIRGTKLPQNVNQNPAFCVMASISIDMKGVTVYYQKMLQTIWAKYLLKQATRLMK